jgi:hypothetical protein
VNHFAADVDPVKAKVMHAVQEPLGASTLEDVMGVPDWKALPTWSLVAAGDQAIPPDAERQFVERMGATTVEVPSNHLAIDEHQRNPSTPSASDLATGARRLDPVRSSLEFHVPQFWD